MASSKELNQEYRKIYNKDFLSATLSKWSKEGKIKRVNLNKDLNKQPKYDYCLEDFMSLITSEKYARQVYAKREQPRAYIGKTSGYLLITGVVPREEYLTDYKRNINVLRLFKLWKKEHSSKVFLFIK